MLRSLRRAMDGGPDALIRAAAADVGHRRVDVGVARVRGLREQRGRGHDLARLAIAALRYVFRDPRLLHRMRAMPQPNFVPVSPSVSRSTQRSGVSGATVTVWRLPLTVKEIGGMTIFPQQGEW